MNRYEITYYNSGGYRAREIIETEYEIRYDEDNILKLFRGNVVIGNEEEIETLLQKKQGWVEERTVVAAQFIGKVV